MTALLLLLVLLLSPAAVRAQTWNTGEVLTLVDRGIERRNSVQADSGLRSFKARAHGFVFFLGQLGEGFSAPPRLVKSDQLELEVYWRAPGLSKQIILGRRDRRDLPTDIQYHRDHLGIVQNNFGDRIRFGDGDEVRDVPHPLGPGGPGLYDYAMADSLTIELPDRKVRVYQVLVRPKNFSAPGVVGALFMDMDTAELVRFRFSFTPAAYRDNTLEDITVVLDNGLWFGKYWLPRRQEIEIRRRMSYLELPVRMIIRGRWEIADYEFNPDLPPGLFNTFEPEITYAPKPVRDSFPWEGTLAAGIDSALGPVEKADLDKIREELTGAVANHALTGLPKAEAGFGSLSDLVHVNRVEGLAPGFGFVRRMWGQQYRLWLSYGLGDKELKFRGSLDFTVGPLALQFRGSREIRDVGDEPVISRIANSFMAQERGYDFGDYVMLEQYSLRFRRGGPTASAALSLGMERTSDATVTASPATGEYRSNPALGENGRRYGVARLEVNRHARQFNSGFVAEGGISGEAHRYVRFRGAADFTAELGSSVLGLSGWAGWGSAGLPPYRPFVIGGRGTLPGEPFRAWGGRYAALGRVDFRFPVPFPAIPLGAFGSTGNRARFGPFIAAGWAGGQMAGAPWIPSQEIRAVAGGRLELIQGLLQLELGVGLRDGRTGFSLDFRKDLWPIL